MGSHFATKQEPGRYTGDGVRCRLCGVVRMRADEIREDGTCVDSAWCLANQEGRPGPRPLPYSRPTLDGFEPPALSPVVLAEADKP